MWRRVDVAQAVDRTAERVDHAADELGTDRHLEHARRAADLVAFLQLEVVAEDDGADVVLFEVQRERGDLCSPVSDDVTSSISPAIAFLRP